MKKFFVGLLVFILALVSPVAGYSQSGTSGLEFFYSDDSRTTALVMNGNVISGSVIIPASFSNLPVTVIGNYAFQNTQITDISIPTSVKSIGMFAFSGCKNLTNITLPSNSSLETIGLAAFQDTNLTSITIPASVMSIANGALGPCINLTSINVNVNNPNYSSQNGILFNKALTEILAVPGGMSSVNIPASVTSIGVYAFHGCKKITSITISSNITDIKGSAFNGCTSLTSITIPTSVTTIGMFAFFECTNLTSVTFLGTISSDNLSSNNSFLGDLRTKYLVGGIGTYIRELGSNTWIKR